jgi:hypothetical protein
MDNPFELLQKGSMQPIHPHLIKKQITLAAMKMNRQ